MIDDIDRGPTAGADSQRMPRSVTGPAGVSSRPKLSSHHGGESGRRGSAIRRPGNEAPAAGALADWIGTQSLLITGLAVASGRLLP